MLELDADQEGGACGTVTIQGGTSTDLCVPSGTIANGFQQQYVGAAVAGKRLLQGKTGKLYCTFNQAVTGI